MDIDKPLKQILNPDNYEDRLQGAEDLLGANASAKVETTAELSAMTGTQLVGNLISPAVGVTDMEVTSTDFTGTFVSGEGATFNNVLYNIGGVNAGVLQFGAKQSDGALVAGAGKVVLNSSGIITYDTTDVSEAMISFYDASANTRDAYMWFNNNTTSNTRQLGIYLTPTSSTDTNTQITLYSASPSANESRIDIVASKDVVTPVNAIISLISSSDSVSKVWINSEEADADTIISSDGVTNMVMVDGGLNAVGIGAAASSDYTLKVTGTLGITEGQIVSGTYTPTLTNTTNIAASTASAAQYMRVGSVVTASGRITIDPTAAGTIVLGITLPVTSNIGGTANLCGTAANSDVAGYVAAISGDATNNRATLTAITSEAANRIWYYQFTYLIV